MLARSIGELEQQYGDNYLEGTQPTDKTPRIMDHRIGVIRVDGGPGSGNSPTAPPAEDFADARYWVEFHVPKYTLAKGDRFDLFKDDIPGIAEIVTAVNFAELPTVAAAGTLPNGGCHLLSPGLPVHCTLWRTRGTPSLAIWMFFRDPSPVRVKIVDATGCGKGYYNATATKRPTADIDKSTDLTSTSLGTAGPAVTVRNLQEINRASADPWLTHGDNADQLDYIGTLAYVNSDGTAVIDINAAWFEPCEVAEEEPE